MPHALVRADVSEERFVSNFRLKTISVLGTTIAVARSPILVALMMEAIRSSKTSVLTRATRCNIVEDGFLYSHRRKNLKSYIALTGCAL
jgi:hypothetical protein